MDNDIFTYKYKTEEIGRNPKDISKLTYVKYGIPILELIDVVRERCADCKVTELAIRKCSKVRCSSWPYRLGTNPFIKPDKPYKNLILYSNNLFQDIVCIVVNHTWQQEVIKNIVQIVARKLMNIMYT